MKKIAIILCVITILSLASCGLTQKTDTPKTETWFDCLNGDEHITDGRREINLDEYEGVTFQCLVEKVTAVTDSEITPLFTGMPIVSAYFADLTGDGKRELCSTAFFGSGIVDSRIIVYDYMEKKSYELSDRGYYDFRLNMVDGKLVCEKREYTKEDILVSGELILDGETLKIKAK